MTILTTAPTARQRTTGVDRIKEIDQSWLKLVTDSAIEVSYSV